MEQQIGSTSAAACLPPVAVCGDKFFSADRLLQTAWIP
jgi:hypothetical protein